MLLKFILFKVTGKTKGFWQEFDNNLIKISIKKNFFFCKLPINLPINSPINFSTVFTSKTPSTGFGLKRNGF
ncbi:unnamed protein product [Rhizophagus irregularis]|nr:unnamed protein product [Rhizophagus irregularis]